KIELFFKWIKQNLKVKTFLGRSPNAVPTQLWIALCVYLLLAFLKFKSRLGQSLTQILRLLQLNLFERRNLIELFKPPCIQQSGSHQLLLWR
ncbi:MAG: IS4 family transposase, partial [Sphingobacteriia bacterium]|nr:IS4 family transposase [Sphingobacteriia bacterium]